MKAMVKIGNITEALDLLASFERPASSVAYTLTTIRELMTYLGDPQEKMTVVHIAGTSGKTSTSYYSAALLKNAGYSVGLSVSPHIDSVLERTQINGVLIDETEYCELLGEFVDLVTESGLAPSYYELLVAFSYWTFARKGLDFAVMEVGLGGLLDGTNVVKNSSKICIITDIGYDHMNVLGNTLSKIANQKAGIILPGNDVFMYEQSPEVMESVRETVEQKQACLHIVDGNTTLLNYDEYKQLPLFQQRNLTLAYSALSEEVENIPDEAALVAMNVIVPGRMESVVYKGFNFIMDGSHNEQKIGSLVESLKQKYPDTRMTLVVSFGANRQESMVAGLKLLKTIGDEIIITTFTTHQDMRQQSLATSVIADEAREAGFTSIYEVNEPSAAIAKSLELENKNVLITGSFYMLQYVRPQLLDLG